MPNPGFWENQFVQVAGYVTVAIFCMAIFLVVFEMVTKYNNWEEIKKGNFAVALATGGKIFGISNIFRYSIENNDSFILVINWAIFGYIILLVGYFAFEFLTPKLNVDDEIKNNNTAVGFLACILSIGLSFIIGAGLSTF